LPFSRQAIVYFRFKNGTRLSAFKKDLLVADAANVLTQVFSSTLGCDTSDTSLKAKTV